MKQTIRIQILLNSEKGTFSAPSQTPMSNPDNLDKLAKILSGTSETRAIEQWKSTLSIHIKD